LLEQTLAAETLEELSYQVCALLDANALMTYTWLPHQLPEILRCCPLRRSIS